MKKFLEKNYLLDYVIIDESSQVDLLTGVLAMSCCKNIIIVGDTKQINHIVNNSMEEKLKDVKVDHIYNYADNNILSSVCELYGDDLPKTILREHYRCHPKIIEFCNKKYYDNQLISFREGKPDDEPLMIYYSQKGNHARKINTENTVGRYNQRELDIFNDEIIPEKLKDYKSEDIGFISPYRLQANKAEYAIDKGIQSDTVHKFQGREKLAIVMSTVLDKKSCSDRQLKFIDNPTLINVAVSRAIDKFILVTDKEVFENQSKEIKDLIGYIQYSTLNENVFESNIVSVFDLLYHEYASKLNEFKDKLEDDSKYKSENIMNALIKQILKDEKYSNLKCLNQVFLKNIIMDTDDLYEEEKIREKLDE